ncbi:hypothetical protein TSUD_376200 [Trifolium subterraneum]|uniref:F-box associated domain-containing protein n=1 Tax=Trifolium subterraneum TaxID=3900 RepID=A0A2Z6M1A5_TRISU|nr:hypothetical protein TSUD_376200 [Trifolium subterraneum]
MMDSKSSSSSKVSRSYTPLLFYMDSTESKMDIIPPSIYNTIVFYNPSASNMDIYLCQMTNYPVPQKLSSTIVLTSHHRVDGLYHSEFHLLNNKLKLNVPRRRLTVLNGSIALISNYHDDIVFHISILGEIGVSESRITLYIYGPLPFLQWPPIGFGKMGYMFFEKKDYQVAYFDLNTQIIEDVGTIPRRKTSSFIVGLYKGSRWRSGN